MAGADAQTAERVRQELRIAPVMTGGTSLSVWMGGVTCELYCLLAGGTRNQVGPPATSGSEAEPSTVSVYRDLLSLSDLEPRVDVITGTSAGGLNGTLLAAAWRNWVPAAEFAKLRTTWLDLADLQKLLRRPTEVEPPSLLKGDAYFRAEIEKVLSGWKERGHDWRTQGRGEHPEHPLDLLITVTTVDAEARSRRDDFGESISDVNHAHRLLFQTQDVSSDDPTWPTKLAIASRTSACIPGVFEPSYLPIGDADATKSGLPKFDHHASFKRSHFAVDGGVVVNLPLREALERVFYQPADAPVRRVVMFVQPTPKAAKQPAVEYDAPPTIGQSVLTVVSAPRAEGITSEVDRIRQHNDAVQRQAAARRSLNALIGDDIVAQAQALMPAYRQQRARSSVQRTSGHVVRELDAAGIEARDVENWLRPTRHALVPERVGAEGTAEGPEWAWGIATVEHAASMVLNLIRCARPALQQELRPQWAELSDLAERVKRVRDLDRAHWSKRLRALGTILSEDAPSADRRAELDALDIDIALDDLETASIRRAVLTRWARLAYAQWPADASTPHREVTRGATLADLRDVYHEIVDVLVAVGAVIRAATEPRRARRLVQHRELLADLDALAPERATVNELRIRLRAIHVLQTMLMGDVVAREQVVELQVVSWNAVDHLTGRTTDDKLAGPELARLGAFLKRSWRANDWFWGRMDGASRLTEMLLASEHLHRALDLPDRTAQEAVDRFLASPTLAECADAEKSVVREELLAIAAADNEADAPRPDRTIEIVARRLQLEIAREELPHIRDAVQYSRDVERSNELNGARFLERYEAAERQGELGPATTKELVDAMRVGKESVGTEFGYGLLNRTISRGGAVAVNALSSDRAGVPFVAKFLKPLRTPLHTVNSVVSVSTSSSPLFRFVTVLVFAVTGALVGLRVAGVDVATPLVLAAEILLGGALLTALARSGFWWHVVPLAIVIVVLGLAIVGSDVDEVMYSGAPPPITGDVPAGSVIDLGDDGTARIIRSAADGTEMVDDIAAGPVRIQVRTDGATWTECDSDDCEDAVHVAPWKQRLFTEDHVVRWLLVVAALITILATAGPALRLVVERTRATARRSLAGAGFAALVLVTIWLVAFDHFDSMATWLLTGESQNAPAFKSWISTAATELGEYRIEVIVLVMIGVAVLLGTAYDLTLRRWSRWLRARLAVTR